jgi:PAS domain S-box-containing protein
MNNPSLVADEPQLTEEQAQAILEGLSRVSLMAPAVTPAGVEIETPPLTLPPRQQDLLVWSAQNFAELVEALPDAVVVINRAGTIVLINRQTEGMFGYGRDELLGQAIEILVPQRVRHAHVGHRERYFAAPRARPMGGTTMELTGCRKSGSEFPVEISLSPLVTDQGLLVTSVIRDISARKRQEAKFRTLVENIPAVTFIAPLDESAPELYVSPQIEELLGFTQREWLDDPVLWHRQLHPEDMERWNHQFSPTCSSGTPFRSAYRFIAKDGRVVWIHGSANLVRDAEGKLLFLQGVAFDITGIKEAEATLLAQAHLAGLRADISAICTQAEKLADLLRRCAESLEQHLGASLVRIYACASGTAPRLESQAGTCIDLVRFDLAAAALVEEVATGRRPIQRTDLDEEWARSEGVASFAGYPLLIEDHLLGVLAVFARQAPSPAVLQTLELVAGQIALGVERKQKEEDLLRANADLERRVRERTAELERSMERLGEKTAELEQFAYVATHDLVEPLRSIHTSAQRLQKETEGQLAGKVLERIARMIGGAESMRLLIEKLREYEHVNRREQVREVDCNEAVARACANLQAAFEESGAVIHVAPLPTLAGVPEHLVLLFQNLIGNAIKYRSVDRRLSIEVGCERKGDDWLFSVHDNGMGIEEKYFRKIFGLGERLHARSKIPGWGYGLAICEKTVMRHGGRIWVASELDRGSTFFFTLPVQPLAAGAPT